MQSQTGLLFLLIGVVLGCYVFNLLAARKSVKSLGLSGLSSIKTVEKRKTTIPVEITNESSQNIGNTVIYNEFGILLKIGEIRARSTVHSTPEMIIPTRGVYHYRDLRLMSTYPFGLVKVSTKVKKEGEIIVYPELYNVPCPRADGFEPTIGGSFKGSHKTASGTDFAGVRPYQPYDSVKSIHWKSSSKGQGMMAKEFQEELSGRISFIFDCDPGEGHEQETEFDRAIRAAGSLMFAALDKEHHVEMINLNDMEIIHNPSFMDGSALLEALARLEPVKGVLNREALESALIKVSARAAICFVMTHVNEVFLELLERVSEERRVVSICLPQALRKSARIPSSVHAYFYGSRHLLRVAK